MRWLLKIIHNHHIALLWAFGVEVVVHLFFSLQGFLLGGFLGEIALATVFGTYLAQRIGAWLLAGFIFCAAFVMFVLGQYLREHVVAYARKVGDQSYVKAFDDAFKLVMGLEICSLIFRLIQIVYEDQSLHGIANALITLALGIIGLLFAMKMARVIHASVNRPVEHDLARSQHNAGMTLAEKAMRYTKSMNPEQLARWNAGDPTALQEVAGNGFFEAEQKRQAKASRKQAKYTKQLDEQQREQAGAEEQRRAGETASKLLNPSNWIIRNKPEPKADPNFTDARMIIQADHLSQRNGSH